MKQVSQAWLKPRLFYLLFASACLLGLPTKLKAQDEVPLWKQFAEILKVSYYEPSRFKPRDFFEAYIDFLQRDLYLLKIEKNPDAYRWLISGKVYTIKLDEQFDLYKAFQSCEQVFKSLPQEWWGQALLPKDKVYYQALSQALKTLDPHTKVLSPKDTMRYLDRSGNLIYSIGVWVKKTAGLYEVQTVYKESPAEEAKVAAGDLLLEVNGQVLQDLPMLAVQNLLESNIKNVAIEIQKPNGNREAYNVEAEPVDRPSVNYKLINGEIGYIRIDRFTKDTHLNFLHAIHEMKTGMPPVAYFDSKQGWKFEEIPDKNEFGALQSLVIDLRGNPGGLLEEAAKICEEFLPIDSPIVFIKANDKNNQKLYTNKKNGNLQIPMVLLIDENSASAAEILAGCLQHYNRALVVGRHSFGKGSVQEGVVLKDESVKSAEENSLVFFKYLIAEYFVANAVPIQNLGISPNLEVDLIQLEKDRIKLQPVKSFQEKDYVTAIKSSDRVPRIENKAFKRFIYWENKEKDLLPFHDKYNFPLELSIELLKGEEAREDEKWNMKEFYYRKKDLCVLLEENQMKKLDEVFLQFGLDWKSGGPYSKNFKPNVELIDFKDHVIVVAGVENEVELNLKNISKIPAYRLKSVFQVDQLNIESEESYWGSIDSLKSKTSLLRLNLPKDTPVGEFEGLLTVFDENHIVLEKTMTLKVTNKALPVIGFRVESFSENKLVVRVKNFSSFEIKNNTFKIKRRDDDIQIVYQKSIRNIQLNAEESRELTFELQEGLSLNDLFLTIIEEDYGLDLKVPISIASNYVDDSYYKIPLGTFCKLLDSKRLKDFSELTIKEFAENEELNAVWLSDKKSRLGYWSKGDALFDQNWKPSACVLRVALKNNVQIRKKIFLK